MALAAAPHGRALLHPSLAAAFLRADKNADKN